MHKTRPFLFNVLARFIPSGLSVVILQIFSSFMSFQVLNLKKSNQIQQTALKMAEQYERASFQGFILAA